MAVRTPSKQQSQILVVTFMVVRATVNSVTLITALKVRCNLLLRPQVEVFAPPVPYSTATDAAPFVLIQFSLKDL